MTLWLLGGWISVFRFGFAVRGPGVNLVFWLGAAK